MPSEQPVDPIEVFSKEPGETEVAFGRLVDLAVGVVEKYGEALEGETSVYRSEVVLPYPKAVIKRAIQLLLKAASTDESAGRFLREFPHLQLVPHPDFRQTLLGIYLLLANFRPETEIEALGSYEDACRQGSEVDSETEKRAAANRLLGVMNNEMLRPALQRARQESADVIQELLDAEVLNETEVLAIREMNQKSPSSGTP